MRRPLVVGNWKMNGNKRSVAELLEGLLAQWQGMHQAEVAVCAPYVFLSQVERQLQESNIHFGSQDVSEKLDGAFTGDISAAMLVDMYCHFVIVGHSERREYHKESDQLVAQKFAAAQEAKMTPILCVGETLAERDADETLAVIGRQLSAVKELVGRENLGRAVIAYEPVWAIGTGRTATPEQAEDVHRFIREQLGDFGARTRILYGGSVKPDSAEALFKQPNIDGGLIGGASLKADDFIAICKAADLAESAA
ncbi:triose-phosphate isomerase [Aurantivibrio plasticivorans]